MFFEVACETERLLLGSKLLRRGGGSIGPTPRAGRSCCDSAGLFPSSPSRTSGRGDRRGRGPLDTRPGSLNRLLLPPSRQRQRLLLLLVVPPRRQRRKLFLAKRVSAEVLCNTSSSSPPRPWLLLGRCPPLELEKAWVSKHRRHPHHRPATLRDPNRGGGSRCSALGCQNGCGGAFQVVITIMSARVGFLLLLIIIINK